MYHSKQYTRTNSESSKTSVFGEDILYSFVEGNLRLNTRQLFAIVLFLCILLIALQPVNDPDFWWHLRTGQLIAETGQIPRTDPFSYTMQGQPWIAHEWLTDWILYAVYRLGGLPFLMLLFALIITAAFATVYFRCSSGTKPYIAGFCVLFGAVASRPLWGVRPQMITLLFFGIFLLLLEKFQKSRQRKYLIPLPILMVIWVNLHGAFILGLALLGVFLAGELVEWLWRRFRCKEIAPGDAIPMITLAVTLLISVLAALINPNGVNILLYPFQTLTDPSMQQFILEWHSPAFSEVIWLPLMIILLGLIGTGLAARQRYSVTRVLLILAFTYAALGSARHVPLFAIVVIPTLADQVNALLPIKVRQGNSKPIMVLLNWVILIMFVAAVGLRFIQQSGIQDKTTADHYPQGAVNWILENKPTGRMLNSYDWGGYLIWQLYPEYQVYIDGRADVYGPGFFAQYADIYLAEKDWQTRLEEQKIGFVLIDPASRLAEGLSHLPGWKLVYQDKLSVIYQAAQ
jgi:hypothetical protein